MFTLLKEGILLQEEQIFSFESKPFPLKVNPLEKGSKYVNDSFYPRKCTSKVYGVQLHVFPPFCFVCDW